MGLYDSASAVIDFDAISDAMQTVVVGTFNAEIEILQPDITGGAFDRMDNTKERTSVSLWVGKARIQAMRWPNVATARQEAISARTVVFHIPLDEELDSALIHEGWRVHVTACTKAPEFIGGLYVITSGVNSSYAWDRRIECTMDQGANI